MAEITLGDYAGYIFLEMVKAREMADAYSRAVAQRYAQDEILQFFSVPRFKTPKMEITVPVLVSGARFRQTVRFDVPVEEFVATMERRADDVRTAVHLSPGGLPSSGRRPSPGVEVSRAVEKISQEFHAQLSANPDPLRPDAIVADMWRRIFRTALGEGRLLKQFEKFDPEAVLLERTAAEVLDFVRSRTVVSKTEIESLLVNPETNVVKNGSSDTSVFVVRVELLEEGFYLRTVRDDESGPEHTIVEFD